MTKTPKELSEINKLLNSEESIAIYNTLYFARTNNKKLTVSQILEKINKRYGCEVNDNKVWKILGIFISKNVIHKDINQTPHKYYLDKIIYTPSQFTPIPTYQIILLILNVVFLIYSHIRNYQIIFNLLLGSLLSILVIMLIHHMIFEIANERHYAKKFIKVSLSKVVETLYEVNAYRKFTKNGIKLLNDIKIYIHHNKNRFLIKLKNNLKV